MSFDSYYKLTLDDMGDYIEANAPDKKEAFKKALFPMTPKKRKQPKLDVYGNPVMKYSEKKKKWYAVQEYVVIEGSPEEAKYSLASARGWFIETFKHDEKIAKLTPNNKTKKTEDKPKKTDRFKNW